MTDCMCDPNGHGSLPCPVHDKASNERTPLDLTAEQRVLLRDLRGAVTSGRGNYGHRLLCGQAAEEIENILRRLNLRDEQIDGYERQLGIIDAGAERTIGSEIARLLAAAPVATTDWEAEIEGALDLLGEHAVRVREGGGPENLAASLALTFAQLDPNARPVETEGKPRAHIGDAVGWVPVTNSLPSHGRKVIATYLNDLGNRRTVFAKHIESFKDCADDYDIDGDIDAEWFDVDAAGSLWVPEGWYEETETHEQCLKLTNAVTHWRPMPASPEKTSVPISAPVAVYTCSSCGTELAFANDICGLCHPEVQP